jgi:hypothetical protein
MRERGLSGIALYPELRHCSAPSAARVLEIFDDIQRHHLRSADETLQVFEPKLNPLQLLVLDLLHVPTTVYTSPRTR